MKIYKYEIPMDTFQVTMPVNPKILSAGQQDGRIMIWAMVETNAECPKEVHYFPVVPTGLDLEDISSLPLIQARFINTVSINQFVFHVFYYGPITT